MTREEAEKMYESRWWMEKTLKEIAEFQVHEDKLCCPISVYHTAVEEWLGRAVATHELADPELLIAEKKGE